MVQTQGLVPPDPNPRVPTLSSCLGGDLALSGWSLGSHRTHCFPWAPSSPTYVQAPALVLSPGSCSSPTRCSASTAKSLLFRFLPFLRWVPRYPVKEWLLGDITSGFSMGIMHLPQGE